ncbi:protein ECT2-like isoform X2 [Ctenocephalides felis]|uniref:protein ECT2-like isoform X2 n=1 Tax=Ctenocephalides felis TaxID=7515 RepID=UPI000E6E43DD|nr:protein ECT2-like isoform X2 [Ctenocephalides felis]
MNLKLTDFNMEVTDSDTNSSNYKETNKSEPSNTSPEDDATGCEDEDEDELLPSTSSSCKSTQLKPSLDSACSSIPVSSSNVEIGSSRSPKCYTKLPADVRVCLIGDCASDTAVCAAARVFGYPVVTDPQCTAAKDGNDPQNGGCIVYVMREFAGEAYEVLHKTRHRIIGPTALCQLADRHLPMPLSSRPLYSLSMSGLVVCFTGFRKKEDLTRLIGLIHHMGGSIRKDMVSKVTHLIANCTGGEKYRYAMTFRVPVVSAKWVESSWEKRQDVTHDARNEAFISEHKLKPFQGSRVCFLGFPADEQQHMSEILVENGGVLVELEDPSCTHVVMPNGEMFSSSRSRFNITSQSATQKCLKTPDQSSYTHFPNKVTPMGSGRSDKKSLYLNNMESTPVLSHCTPRKRLSSSECLHFDDLQIDDDMRKNCADFSIMEEEKEIDTDRSTRSVIVSPTRKRPRDSPEAEELKTSKMSPPKFYSAKKPKLQSRPSLKRSLSFVAMRTPLANMLKSKKTTKKISDEEESAMNESRVEEINSASKKSDWNKLKMKLMNKKQTETVVSTSDSVAKDDTDYQNESCDSVAELRSIGGNSSYKTPVRRRSLCCTPEAYQPPSPSPQNKEVDPSSQIPLDNAGGEVTLTLIIDHNMKTSTPHAELFKLAEDVKRALKFSVVDESTTGSAPETATSKTQIVKAEWFWKSVQNEEQADEREYLFENYLESLLSTPARTTTPANVPGISTPASGPSSTRQRKRRRLHETLSALAQTDTTLKRRSSVSDAGLLSVSGSFLDCTVSPDKQLLDKILFKLVEGEGIEINRKNLSPRQQVFLELVQTESNYVSILHTIMTMFKSPLEEMLETSPNEAILNATELKIIFGNLPPIYDLHRKMLEELRWASSHWAEDTSIGNIILKHAPDLVKAYPPFVNFFENMKEMLVQCDQSKTRFHAFLKICQTRPECGRQSLQELMIRPVQRLPSISLLLNDILKHTPKSNLDYNALEKALESIKEVMTYINEDKRKTEAQMVMFDIFNDIDNCPPHLVSSHRSFISRCEVMELSDGLSGRGDHLVLYLFSDILEVCKKRSKAFNSLKSPNAIGKPYKHVKLMPLSHVKRVIDIHETEVFALTCRSNQELKEKLYSFTITEEDVDKTTFLRSLCRQMANTVCKADADRFMASLNSKQLEIDTSDVSLGTLSKAFKFASRTRMKVGRAFSFNKTPSKFKRAVSTMMSPFGSTNNLTPSSQLAQMRLASCNNINELGGAPNNVNNEMLVAPMSVQPTRKTKCSSLSIAALRRL